MRLRVTFLAFCLAQAWPGLWADTIHLKNGRKILADHVRENGNRYQYEVGDDSYGIPKSAVDHVEAGGFAARSSATEKLGDLPSFDSAAISLAKEGDLTAKIIRDGKVDQDGLSTLEAKGNPVLSSTANFIAGKFEFEHGNIAHAQQYFESALRFQPESATVLTYYAAVLARTGNSGQALPYAERAVRANPDSADAYTMLGYAQFASDHTKDAIVSWKRSLALRPDASVQRFLDKAQREQAAEAEFVQNESSHFVLHYEGKQSEALGTQILAALEADYDDLVRDLGSPPRDSIQVTLYTETAFFDVTHAPSWVGALNDGKLRIPISGLTSVSPELAHVLKHELAHSFVAKLSAGRCPPWLNEGIAQFLEPRSLAGDGRQLAHLFKTQQNLPFNVLEGSFMKLSGGTAYIAYAESLAAVTFISDSYGLSDVQRILERISQGNSTEAALRATIHSDYGQFEMDLGRYLADKYGE